MRRAQSGTFAKSLSDFPPEAGKLASEKRDVLVVEAFKEMGIPKTPDNELFWRLLCGYYLVSKSCRFEAGINLCRSLGSHDLSTMREALGMPQKAIASTLTRPIWSATFQYAGFVVHCE